jgi:nicotinate-nucleotide adenylyltransferase
MRVGLFGGAFDPVHLGHLLLAERCREDAHLDEVWFLPSYRPPHKDPDGLTRFEHRLDMLGFAVSGQPAFRVEPVEKELPPPSFTLHTLHALADRHPGHEFHLLVGADTLADLPNWHRPAEVLKLAGLVAVPRPGAEVWDAGRLAAAVGADPAAVRLTVVDMPLIALASRDLRARVAAGKGIRYAVPRAVEEFVRERGLYRG